MTYIEGNRVCDSYKYTDYRLDHWQTTQIFLNSTLLKRSVHAQQEVFFFFNIVYNLYKTRTMHTLKKKRTSIYFIIYQLIQYRSGGNHFLRILHYIWGISFASFRILFWCNSDRKHGSIWSTQHPCYSHCNKDIEVWSEEKKITNQAGFC